MTATTRSAALAAALALLSFNACAALVDEIQVYTDDINTPGEFGVELHVNSFPHGRKTPDYPGEVTTHRSIFITPEFSYGLTKTVDVGLYVPTVRDGATGNYAMAGYKFRLKWLPIKGDKETGGWFAGTNFEIGRVSRRYDLVQGNAELRFMLGWRDEDWLFGINPTIGKGLSDGSGNRRPDTSFGVKGTRRVSEGYALGLEYYTGYGEIGRTLPWGEQDNKVFVVLDVDRHPWVFNLGIGHGLTQAAEKTTVKMIFELPF